MNVYHEKDPHSNYTHPQMPITVCELCSTLFTETPFYVRIVSHIKQIPLEYFSYIGEMPLEHLLHIKETSWNTSGRT